MLHAIPKPQLSFSCDQDWRKMKATERGRFCDACSHDVLDLTKHSQADLNKIINQSNGHVCGIVLPEQVRQPNFWEKSWRNVRWWRRFAFCLLAVFGTALFTVSTSYATKAVNHVHRVAYNSLMNATGGPFFIKGQVVDSNGQAMTGCNVYLELGDELISGTAADIDGYFELKIDANLIDDWDSVVLKASYIGYEKLDFTDFHFGEDNILHVNFVMDIQPVTLGEGNGSGVTIPGVTIIARQELVGVIVNDYWDIELKSPDTRIPNTDRQTRVNFYEEDF